MRSVFPKVSMLTCRSDKAVIKEGQLQHTQRDGATLGLESPLHRNSDRLATLNRHPTFWSFHFTTVLESQIANQILYSYLIFKKKVLKCDWLHVEHFIISSHNSPFYPLNHPHLASNHVSLEFNTTFITTADKEFLLSCYKCPHIGSRTCSHFSTNTLTSMVVFLLGLQLPIRLVRRLKKSTWHQHVNWNFGSSAVPKNLSRIKCETC